MRREPVRPPSQRARQPGRWITHGLLTAGIVYATWFVGSVLAGLAIFYWKGRGQADRGLPGCLVRLLPGISREIDELRGSFAPEALENVDARTLPGLGRLLKWTSLLGVAGALFGLVAWRRGARGR